MELLIGMLGNRPQDLGKELVRAGLNNMSATHIMIQAEESKDGHGTGTARFCESDTCTRCLEWPMTKSGVCGISIHGYVSAFWHFPGQEPPNPAAKIYTKASESGGRWRTTPRFGAVWMFMLWLLSGGPLLLRAAS